MTNEDDPTLPLGVTIDKSGQIHFQPAEEVSEDATPTGTQLQIKPAGSDTFKPVDDVLQPLNRAVHDPEDVAHDPLNIPFYDRTIRPPN